MLNEFFATYTWSEPTTQLLLALILGALLGVERSYLGKSAGTRTFSLIAVGSALFTIISLNAFSSERFLTTSYDPSRIAAQIIAAVGFISMAVVIHKGSDVEGITTAVGIWIAAGIGMAVGVKFYGLALVTTIISLLIMGVVRLLDIENKLQKLKFKIRSSKKDD